ncbi:MAG: T9SS type A sorting domain-containing protein [Bacteroidetes bacterium]|nr:T9SS type A sorting domain-containing protein [Bacteroidota bacterium]
MKMIYSTTIRLIRNLVMVALMFIGLSNANAIIPRPDHTVILVLENHSYWQVISSPSAPYINALSQSGANMVEYYALTHPSQPNYIMLFAGDNLGVTNDNLPSGTPWSTPNLGASLINNGFTFKGYSENLPSTGSTAEANGAYGRKHSPWVNWQGTGLNQIPSYCNETMNGFPSDYNLLPDVSFVIPDMDNDMHNGTDPARVIACDDWVQAKLGDYVNWAMGHNSLLIVLFDEDDNYASNHIPCFFVGPMVQQGNYATNGYDHYDMLRTIEDMYALPYLGASANSTPIEEIWLTNSVSEISSSSIQSNVYPNPVTNEAVIHVDVREISTSGYELHVYDILGHEVRNEPAQLLSSKSTLPFRREGLQSGIYLYELRDEKTIVSTGKIMID